MFPLVDAGISGRFQDIMHLIVTMAVVMLSIASLMLIVYGGLILKECTSLGKWALAALAMMITGAVGTAVLPHNYFGIPEKFSVFAAAGFTAVLGAYLYMGWKGKMSVIIELGKKRALINSKLKIVSFHEIDGWNCNCLSKRFILP